MVFLHIHLFHMHIHIILEFCIFWATRYIDYISVQLYIPFSDDNTSWLDEETSIKWLDQSSGCTTQGRWREFNVSRIRNLYSTLELVFEDEEDVLRMEDPMPS
jgi:hypothetical protein